MIKTVVVTCGATVPFPELIEVLLNVRLLDKLILLGYSRMVVQYGRGFGSRFKELMARVKGLETGIALPRASIDAAELGNDFIDLGRYRSLEILGLNFTPNIQQLISVFADLVISHAGTGSILDALRSGKPLIAVVNTTLMDNHQRQIADKFESRGYLWSTDPQVEDLITCLDKLQTGTRSQLPDAFNPAFQRLLVETTYS